MRNRRTLEHGTQGAKLVPREGRNVNTHDDEILLLRNEPVD